MVEKEIAEKFAEKYKGISIAEFFEKNRHLLGFDSKVKSMLTCVKEAVDNSLDACEELAYEQIKRKETAELPEIRIEIKKAEKAFTIVPEGAEESIAELIRRDKEWYIVYMGKQMRASSRNKNVAKYNLEGTTILLTENNGSKPEITVNGQPAKIVEQVTKFYISVIDNGPGIVKEHLPDIFGRMLYGSKFHRLKQGRGQQGIGIHSAVLYAQLTTGRPAKITSRIAKSKPAHMMEVMINTAKNEPQVISDEIDTEFKPAHGTKIELFIDGEYVASGEKSVYEFIRRAAIVNPHATIVFVDPEGETFRFDRTTKEIPKESYEIKTHPHGLQLGILMRMLRDTDKKTLKLFMTHELSRVSPAIADDILEHLKLENKKPQELERYDTEALLKALQKAPLLRPPTDCLSPIGAEKLEKSITSKVKPEFIAVESRPPAVYSGMPFLVEAAIAYGGDMPKEGQAQRLRYANKIPLLYDASACAMTEAMQQVDWKRYGVENVSSNGIPTGPYMILVHLASVWVPYTSEGKSAIAGYPEIIKEIKLALQDCARKLKNYLGAKNRNKRQAERRSLFEIYIPELAYALEKLTDEKKEAIEKDLKRILGKGKIDGEEVEDTEGKAPKKTEDVGESEGGE